MMSRRSMPTESIVMVQIVQQKQKGKRTNAVRVGLNGGN